MRRVAIVIGLMALLLPSLAAAQATGLARMTDLWALPGVRPGVHSFGNSSFDRSGLNNDGFTGAFSRLYREDGRHVLFDAQGPGCVYRMWFTRLGDDTRLQFFVDDMRAPVVDVDIEDFFDGVLAPFTPPLVWNDKASSGGFVTYVPICYRERLKITSTGKTYFYSFNAHRYQAGTPVTSFTGDEDYDLARAVYDPFAAGQDPKDTTGVTYATHAVTLPAGEEVVLFSGKGAGQIASLRLTPALITDELLQNVRLLAYFDGVAQPAVDVPLGLFFGANHAGYQVTALLFGQLDGTLFSFFPMPFFAGAVLALRSEAEKSFSLAVKVGTRTDMPDDYAGTFTTVHALSAPPRLGSDHVFLDVAGQGKVVGVVQISGGDGRDYLEGDERYHPDGLRTPTVHGTGTEDYYNGGWYFNQGLFSLPTHGFPMRVVKDGWDTAGMYRVHVGDDLTFHGGAKFSIEHDAINGAIDEDYRSCAFLYRLDEPALVLEAEFDVGDAAAENEFLYAGTADQATGFDFYFYEGDSDLDLIVDSGYTSTGTVVFTVPINPHNDGVRLVRRRDQTLGSELVRVRVDGQDAGLWRSSDRNIFKRWRDTVLDIPAALTQGRDRIEIELVNVPARRGGWFTQYRYWVYSWKRPLLTRLVDLELLASAASLMVGESLELSVGGEYPSGNVDEVAGWVDYELSPPGLAEVVNGRLHALAPGTVRVVATTGALSGNAITIDILPVADDDDDNDNNDNDNDDNDNDNDNDNDAVSPADDDDDGGGCCSG